jgi:riboflavin synthase
MFTGIVEEMGTIVDVTDSGDRRRLRIGARLVLEDAKVGDSTSVNGCCLTITALGDGWWDADVSAESLSRTNLGGLGVGDPVNLERPMRLADRLGGHLVQGHVDAVGEVVEPAPRLRVRMPDQLLPYIIEKGSITVDGVSLTVVDVFDDGFDVALIPHTLADTTLQDKRVGDAVNLEVDMVAKYVERLLKERT